MDRLFYTLLEMSLRGSYIIVILLIARLLLRRAPRSLCCLLWLVAFFRLVCPVSISSVFSLLPREEVFVTPQFLTGTFYTDMAVQHTQQGYIGVSQTAVSPGRILMWVWLAGVLLMAAGSLFSLWRLRRSLRGAQRCEDGVWEVQGLPTAFIVGFLRPRIYLPAGLQGEQREMVLQHERAHLRRGDWLVKLLAHAILCLHWFNPLVWLAFRLLCRDIEIACDERVVRQLGEDRRGDYSRTLLHLAGGFRHDGVLAFGEGEVKGRIRHLLSYKKPLAVLTGVAALVTVLLAAALMMNPKMESRPVWLTELQPEQLKRAELVQSDGGQTSAAWFEEEDQLAQLVEDLRAAGAEIDVTGGLRQEMLSAENPQYEQLYLLMEDGTVHTILHLEEGMLIDGIPYEASDSWEAVWNREKTESGLSEEMTRAALWGTELFAQIEEELMDSFRYDAQRGELSFTVPQKAEGQELALSISGQTADGKTWQGFAEQTGAQRWAAGETYVTQVEGLQLLTVELQLGEKSVTIQRPVGDSGTGYFGISMQNSAME